MRRIVPLLLAALTLVGCGAEDEAPDVAAPAETSAAEADAPGRVVVPIVERDESGLSGTAELVPEDDDTRIVIELDDPEAFPAAAYIQEGDCTAVRAESAEVLALFLDGRSETWIDTELTSLLEGSFALTVYLEESEDLEQPDACGEIEAQGG